jgi:3-oxoacyl-[acyl-carrier-protein] synthase II
VPLKRVVITGHGAVSPFGLGVNALVDAVWNGRSGVQFMPGWQAIQGLKSFLAAPVPDFDEKALLPRVLRRTMGPMAIYAVLAAKEAVSDAGLSQDFLTSGRVGVAVGSTTGSPETYETFYRKFLPKNSIEGIRSGVFFRIMGHSCAANICLALRISGEQWAPPSACTSAAQAIGLGYLLIQAGRQEAMLCGGADEVHPTVTMVFDVVKAASLDHMHPLNTPRPFDLNRDGVVCGGGSGILVLESLDSALRRQARIYCEVLGFGHTNDSEHIANPHDTSMARAMRNALADAGIDGQAIDYVNAHATGTKLGDIAEAGAIHMILGKDVPVSSFKGHMAHTLGAAGALETIVLLEMLKRQEVVPTLNLERPDPDCHGLNLVQSIDSLLLTTVLKNNFALGGVNAALVLRRWTE